MKKLSITGLALLAPVLAMAHDGHGTADGTVWHYLSSLGHAVPLALSAVALILVVRMLRSERKKA